MLFPGSVCTVRTALGFSRFNLAGAVFPFYLIFNFLRVQNEKEFLALPDQTEVCFKGSGRILTLGIISDIKSLSLVRQWQKS